jgi:hypothetical protein
MSPGATVETIRAAHRKAIADGGGCMKGQRGGNDITGYTSEQHVKAIEDGGGSMKDQRGGKHGSMSAEQHAKASGGRASLHESALNILRANWDALPRTWKPSGSQQTIRRSTSYTATPAHENLMVDHVLSYYYDEKVGLLQKQKKEDKAGRYNKHFKYKREDRGFIVAATDGRARPVPKSAQTR